MIRLHWHPFSIIPRRVRILLREKNVADARENARDEIAMHLDVLERRLAVRDWLVDEYSLADICYAPFVTVFDRVELGDLVGERPAVAAWVRRLLDRPAVRDTAPPRVPLQFPPRIAGQRRNG